MKKNVNKPNTPLEIYPLSALEMDTVDGGLH